MTRLAVKVKPILNCKCPIPGSDVDRGCNSGASRCRGVRVWDRLVDPVRRDLAWGVVVGVWGEGGYSTLVTK